MNLTESFKNNLIEFFSLKLAEYGNTDLAARLTVAKFAANKRLVIESLGFDPF